MADDRLDEAIAAVTRAVDRIDAATRGVPVDPYGELGDSPLPPQPRTPPPPAFTGEGAGFAARPTTALGVPQHQVEPQVDPSWSDYEPPFASPNDFQPDPQLPQPGFAPEPSLTPGPPPAPEPQQFLPQQEWQPEPPQQFQAEPQWQPAPPQSFAPAPDPEPEFIPELPAVPVDASAEVHELVGRIVARTQALEDHLDAARTLRAEIAELVSRLAAAADRDH